MRRTFTFGLVLLVTLTGCVVSKSKYTAAIAEVESAKAELEKLRMHRDALEQQLNSLREVNQKLNAEVEAMASELQRIKESRQNEQTLLQAKQAELLKKQRELLAKFQALKNELVALKNQNAALKRTVLRYQKELKEARQKQTASLAPSSKMPPSASPSTQASSSLPSGATSQSTGRAPININTASVSDMVLFLGVSKETAQKIVENRPYRLRGELVAKNVIPKSIFDTIKDRITAAP